MTVTSVSRSARARTRSSDRSGGAASPGPDSGPSRRRAGIVVVVGTRPEAIKLVPVILALRGAGRFGPIVVATGQHHRMVEEVFELAGIDIDVALWVGDAPRETQQARVGGDAPLRRLHRRRVPPRAGDCATPDDISRGLPVDGPRPRRHDAPRWPPRSPAFHLHIPVMHVEAGLRTGGSS